MTKAQLEKRYGIYIEDDSYFHPLGNRFVKQYRMYSADGCQWENGLSNLKAVEAECKKYEMELLSIKKTTEAIENAKNLRMVEA